ncbi:MAG: trypsin-like peptidase domain-containing protein [Deltaproteobacteria bacterium]|nr:trypsin-like peptidase domain-containing protein [Deltaproteobacteria bacterium]
MALGVIALGFVVVGAACEPVRPADYFAAPPLPEHDHLPPQIVPPHVADGPADDAPARVPATPAEPAALVAPPRPGTPGDRLADVGADERRGAGAAAAARVAPVSTDGPDADPDAVPSFVGLFKRLSPSVVNIYTQEVVKRRAAGDPETLDDDLSGTSLGSGMVLDGEGHILTAAHVVENAAEIRVRFIDEEEMPARLVGIDPVRDLAVLKVDGARELVPVVPGDSETLRVGDWVIAIGNPFGLSHTMTKGIVSGMGRSEFVNERLGYLDLIQTDAAINQGSSGGPLFGMDGRVIGINAAVNADGHGIGFAIKWRVVAESLPRLMQGGQVSRSWLGVYLVPRADGPGSGVLIDAVVDQSPAARAGVQPGDVIVGLDEHAVRDVAEFRLRIASAVAGRDISVDLLRRGKPLRVEARLEEARDIR